MGWWSHTSRGKECYYTIMAVSYSQTSPIALSTLDWMTAKNAPKRAPMVAARTNTITRQEQHRRGCLAQHPLDFIGPSATFLISVPWWLCSSESDILWDTARTESSKPILTKLAHSDNVIIPAPHPCSCPIASALYTSKELRQSQKSGDRVYSAIDPHAHACYNVTYVCARAYTPSKFISYTTYYIHTQCTHYVIHVHLVESLL